MDLVKISKAISYYLRHSPQDLWIELEKNGWTDLQIFMEKLSENIGIAVDETLLNQILNEFPKKRFEIEWGKIRAVYWHSVDELEINYTLYKWNQNLFHATPSENVESIMKNWLLPQSRLFIHLTDELETAILTAKRYSPNITVFQLDTSKFINDGNELFIAKNWIYLTKFVSPIYLKIL